MGYIQRHWEKSLISEVDRIVYISCKPTSLVRDLVVLQDRGYRVEKVCGGGYVSGDGECRGGNNDAELWFRKGIERVNNKM